MGTFEPPIAAVGLLHLSELITAELMVCEGPLTKNDTVPIWFITLYFTYYYILYLLEFQI